VRNKWQMRKEWHLCDREKQRRSHSMEGDVCFG
jgi:hypothetical protein